MRLRTYLNCICCTLHSDTNFYYLRLLTNERHVTCSSYPIYKLAGRRLTIRLVRRGENVYEHSGVLQRELLIQVIVSWKMIYQYSLGEATASMQADTGN